MREGKGDDGFKQLEHSIHRDSDQSERKKKKPGSEKRKEKKERKKKKPGKKNRKKYYEKNVLNRSV